jgi:hypothetical protein
MKKIIFILLVFLAPSLVEAQRLVFCESVSEKGEAIDPSNFFVIGDKGGFFNVLIRLDRPVGSTAVTFDVFQLNEEGKEVFDNTIRMKTTPELTWFYKEVTFYREGRYNVYAYDEKNRLLGAGVVEIRKK